MQEYFPEFQSSKRFYVLINNCIPQMLVISTREAVIVAG